MIYGNNSAGFAIDLQDDGKIVVAGRLNGDMAVWRFLENGMLDKEFGDIDGDGNGECINGVGENKDMGCVFHNNATGGNGTDTGYSVKVDKGNNIIVTGHSDNGPDNSMVVWKITSNGRLYSSFGDIDSDGIGECINGVGENNDMGCVVYKEFIEGATDVLGNVIEIQGDGKYVVSGEIFQNSLIYRGFVLRLNEDGSFDKNFNKIGYKVLDKVSNGSQKYAGDIQCGMKIEKNGNIVIAGYSRDSAGKIDMVVWRLRKDGDYDLSFNNTGFVYFDMNGSGNNSAFNILDIYKNKYAITYTFTGGMLILVYENLYQAYDIPESYKIVCENGNDINVESEYGIYGLQKIFQKKDNFILASVKIDFDEDKDFSSIDGDVDPYEYKSFSTGLTKVKGAESTFELYIPKGEDHKGVGICPGAKSLSEVNNNCNGLYYLGEDDSGVSTAIEDGVVYWVVKGVSDTGGFSVELLPETGDDQISLALLGALLVLISISILFKKSKVKTFYSR